MCKSRNFIEIEKVYSAIKDIDRIANSNKPDLLDNIWVVISDIDKKQFDPDNVKIIVDTIRSSLVNAKGKQMSSLIRISHGKMI